MLLNKDHQQILLGIAKSSIEHGLQTREPLRVDLTSLPAELKEERATFVTLQKNGNLRGCIGILEACKPLAEDIAVNAFSAAFKDWRFSPVEASELNELSIHLSLLTPAEPIPFTSEQDLLSQLQPGLDGLILQDGNKRSTFLPSVWSTLPKPVLFLSHLKQKAGLPADYWSDSVKFYRYRADVVS